MRTDKAQWHQNPVPFKTCPGIFGGALSNADVKFVGYVN